MKFYVVCFIVLFSTLSELIEAEQPYTVKNEAFEHFNGLRETVILLDKMKIIGRERLINGTLKLMENMASDHFKFDMELFSSPKGDDQYKRLPMGVPRTTVCEGLKELYTKYVQPSIIEGETTDFPHVPDEGLCPIPAGEYYVKNLVFDTDSWANEIPRGIVKVQLTIYKDEINVGGGALLLRIEDRD